MPACPSKGAELLPSRPGRIKSSAGWWSLGLGLLTALTMAADPVGPMLAPGDAPVVGGLGRVYLVMLNPDAQPVPYQFPETVSAQYFMAGTKGTVSLRREGPESGTIVIAAGGFARRIYTLPLPENAIFPIELSLDGESTHRLVLSPMPPPGNSPGPMTETVSAQPAVSAAPVPATDPASAVAAAKSAEGMPSALRFFEEHFFPHEPMYLLMGWEDPNVKFQISFKYRPLNGDADDPGWLVRHAPRLTNLYLAYTQMSLWDTGAPSSPFYDTAYKPEVFYQWQRVDRQRWADWFGLDLQGGLQHASNGQDGPESRSFNVAYLMPTVRFGNPDGFFTRLSPRVYAYLGDLGDNPDIADYYGHVQLRGTIGWADGVQLSVIGTIGDGFHHGSAQMDLTYPLYRLGGRNLSVYLDLQYFTGYGESLLDYNERTSVFRAGISLWR